MENGILYVNKPKGMTSFDVVYKLRKKLNIKSIGHTGTLDPNAEGLLIVLLGKYTKLLPYCNHDNKEYIATFKFGIKTDTLDIWGETLDTKDNIIITKEKLEDTLNSFLGKQKQIPPMYSAKKVKGKKLYEYARDNKEIKREPIDIFINNIELLSFDKEVKIKTTVSSGTYIRTLIDDIGTKLNTYACMTGLIRTAIGDVNLDNSINLDDINKETMLISNPRLILDSNIEMLESNKIEDIKNGKKLNLNCNNKTVLLTNNEKLLAIYEKVEGNIYICRRGLW